MHDCPVQVTHTAIFACAVAWETEGQEGSVRGLKQLEAHENMEPFDKLYWQDDAQSVDTHSQMIRMYIAADNFPKAVEKCLVSAKRFFAAGNKLRGKMDLDHAITFMLQQHCAATANEAADTATMDACDWSDTNLQHANQVQARHVHPLI